MKLLLVVIIIELYIIIDGLASARKQIAAETRSLGQSPLGGLLGIKNVPGG